MLNILILFIFGAIIFISCYNMVLGYSLVVVSIFLIPRAALYHHLVSFISNYNLLIIGFSLVLIFKEGNLMRRVPPKLLNQFILYFLICVILFFFSTTVPPKTQFAAYVKEFMCLLLALEAYVVFKNFRDIKKFLYVIILCIAFAFCYGLFTLFTFSNPYVDFVNLFYGIADNEFLIDGLEMDRGITGARMQSVFDHPLTLGQIFALLFSFFILIRFRMNLAIKYTLYAFLILGVFSSGSRSAIVSLIPIFLVIIISMNFKQQLLLSLLTFLSIICIEYNFFSIPDSIVNSIKASVFFWDDSLQSKADIKGSTVDMRLDQFEAAVQKIEKTNPLIGYGLTFREYNQTKLGGLDPDLLGYESVFLLKPVEQGLLGLFSFFYLIWGLYVYCLNTKLKLSWHRKLSFTAFILSFAIGVTMTGVREYAFPLFILFVIVYIKILDIKLLKISYHTTSVR